ncbi:MAG: CpaF family protein, partial [Thermodesulfobacteriota bacterium]
TEESGVLLSSFEVRKRLIKEIADEALELGPLEDLIDDPEITDIMVNGKDQIYVERKGKLELTSKRFLSNEQVRQIIERIIAPLGRRIDESSPMVDARLADGSRVNAIISPLSLGGPMLTIRKFSRERYTTDSLQKFGSLNAEMAEFIRACVISRKNIIVSGGTGSGKTTVLNILSAFIPDNERIITIEDAAELKLSQEHWGRLESRPQNIEGRGAITIRDLFRNTLRMRPDRIIIGECRGAETMDMLQAMNTGHDGSMTTVHANSTHDVLSRLDSMILMAGVELPIRVIREMIASAVDVIVHTARLSDGSRKVTQITEITGMKDEMHIGLQDIFSFRQTGIDSQGKVLGNFEPSGFIPTFIEEV